MKKLLLSGAMLVALSFSAKAQSTSFESSEGYQLGSIYGQQGWITTSTDDEETPYIENQVISSEEASEGVWSLKLNKEEAFPGQSETVVGAYKSFESTGDFSVSYDIYIDEQTEESSDFAVSIFGGSADTGSIAAQLQFRYNGTIVFRFPGTNSQGQQALLGYLFYSEPTWEPQTWYNVEIVYSEESDAFTFYLDGELLPITETDTEIPSIAQGQLMSEIGFRHDNYGGFAYVDNVVMTGVTAGVEGNTLAALSVSPNPANDVINVANAGIINSVKVTDLNGRVVKSANFNGAADAQVNVSDLASGVYMVTVASDKGTSTKKIVKN